jgi:hypothetical protein
LDTLNELAAALGDDANFASTVTASIGSNTSAISSLDVFVGDGRTGPPNAITSIAASNWTALQSGITITDNPDGSVTFTTDGSNAGEMAEILVDVDNVAYEFAANVVGYHATAHYLSTKRASDNASISGFAFNTGGSVGGNGSGWSNTSGYADQVKVIITFGTVAGGTSWTFNSISLYDPEAADAPALDTSAQTIADAVNEVHAELGALSATQSGDTSSLTSAIATAKSEAISTASADATAKADAAEAGAKAYADQVVAATVDAAPAALDTLNELAAALGDDANFASTVTASIATKASQVDHDAEVARATAAEGVNASAIAATNARTSGISTSSGSTDIKMNAEVDMDSNNIKNANDVYAARGFIDHIESNDLKVQTGTVDFEGSIVNFGSSTITGGGFGNATKAEIDQHLNIPTANAGEFVKWTGTDYEWTDLVSGRLATDQLQIASGGSIAATGPGGTFDFQDGIVMLSGSDVRVDTPTDVGQAANKGYVDGVVAATVDAAPAALDTLNELAAALGDDANFSATVTNSIATKADDAATTAALATKADDAATTAALATKEDKTVVDALDLFVKGEPTSAGPVAGAPELGKSTLSTSDFTFPNGVVRSTSGVTGVEIIRPGSEAAAIAITLEVGKTYEVSYRASTWGAMVGSNYMAIIPASVKPTGGHTFNDGYDNNLLFKHYNGQFFPGDEANFQSHHWGNEYEVVETDRIRYITPNVADLHILFWLGGGAFGLADFSIKEYSFGGSPSLDTTVSGVVPAINELHTEINALSSSTTGDKSNLQAQINSEVIRATAAEAANAANIVSETSARSSADAALESDIIGLQNQVGTIIAGSPASLDTLVEIVSAFENADSDLSGVITANGGRLTTAENNITALETDLSAEESARGAGDAALQTQVTAHDGRLTTAEGEIDTLQSQMATRIGTDSDHSAALAVETAARIAGDNANSSEVSLEAATRSAADTQLTSDLSTEVARATQAEGQIASDLAQEVIDRQNADTGLQTQLDFIKENTDPASLDSLTEIVAAFQSADGSITGVVNSNTGRISALESGVVAIEAWNTDNVSEGSINKYWTEQRTKDCLSGGLCITYSSVTGEIKVDEVEAESSLRVAESVASDDADKLGGAAPSHYRIDVYDVNGTIVN